MVDSKPCFQVSDFLDTVTCMTNRAQAKLFGDVMIRVFDKKSNAYEVGAFLSAWGAGKDDMEYDGNRWSSASAEKGTIVVALRRSLALEIKERLMEQGQKLDMPVHAMAIRLGNTTYRPRPNRGGDDLYETGGE